MKLFLIRSLSKRHLLSKEQTVGLKEQHREYHTPEREADRVLLKAMIRPAENAPKGSRVMIMQAESMEEIEEFVNRNPLAQLGAHEHEIYELLPNYGPKELHQWFKGSFKNGHEK